LPDYEPDARTRPLRERLRRDARHGSITGHVVVPKGIHKKIIGIELAAENDGIDIFEQAGIAAE